MRANRLWPLGVAIAAAVALWVVAPEVYTGTVSGWGTFLRVAGLVVVLVGWVLLVRRLVSSEPASAVLAAGPVLVVVGLLLWPYLRPPTEVDEPFPVVSGPSVAAVDEPGVARQPETSTPDEADPPVEPQTSAGSSTPASPSPSTAAPANPPPSPTTSVAAPTAQATDPVELRRATFQGLTGHRGSGDAVLYELADGSMLLRFEEVDIGSGPALDVYVVPGEDQRGLAGSTFVAPLTAERGNQNYTLPQGVDLTSGTWTVLVWCETFAVEVANATLG